MLSAEEVAAAVRTLGLPVTLADTPHPRAFLPGVWIERGELRVCGWSAHPGDVLHEAGHLAIVPSRFRPLTEPGPLLDDGARLCAAITQYATSEEAFRLGPDHWLMRACMQCGEQEAIAWSYAAALHIGLPPEALFLHRYPGVPDKDQPFGGEGGDVLACLRCDTFAGINGLQHGGMCLRRPRPGSAAPEPLWPRMLKWTQD